MSALTATAAFTRGREDRLCSRHNLPDFDEFAALNCFDRRILGTVAADFDGYRPRTADRRRPL